ncbi:flavonol synthase/flavanone 3-hydroxylase [Gymnopus androsaceus JB14]|uniref:Flavonol synthase/flavanone 3-hydroxylase n=1 Tax=Gymnopus androsaceus JB14 TaxID=1447944 RepID=A0A6A4I6Z6_9AGAR|nr:flavonol synthase/flavanone 3-hydroxylase [Gymnopus androsaceus JB14]
MAGTPSLPTIDFAEFGDGRSTEARVIGQKLFAACRDVGFAYLTNTSIPQDQIDGMFDWSAKLFALPMEIKMKAPHPPEGWKHRGYSGIGREQVSQLVFDPDELKAIRTGKFPDFKESFDLGNDQASTQQNDFPHFRAYTVNFYNACREFQMSKLLPALAIGMDLPNDFFHRHHENNENQLRLLHYPEAPTSVFESGEKGRIGAHTDFGTATLLFQDDCGGLEVESPSKPGEFMSVPPVSGTVLVNIGDFLMRWSNDTLKSTLHRVRAPPKRVNDSGMTMERFSIPYFMGADAEKTIECLPGCFGPDKPKKYEPINAGQYLDMRLNATY